MDDFWLSPPVAGIMFLGLVYGLYRTSSALGASGDVHPGKHLSYTGGELPEPLPESLGYHAFFRLALLFGVLHVATLIISTLPQGIRSHRTAVLYVVATAISVFVLTGKEE